MKMKSVKYEAVRDWNEPQGSPSAWVIAVDGICDNDLDFSSKVRCLAAIRELKARDKMLQPKRDAGEACKVCFSSGPYIFGYCDAHRLDGVTRELTAFNSFAALLNAQGGYQPTIDIPPCVEDSPGRLLADEYDAHQEARRDPRRAYRHYL